MKDVREKLISGMDDTSVEYVHYLERVLHHSFNAEACLVNKQHFWTDTDRALFKRNAEWVERGQPPFLKHFNLEGSSIYTNFYGLYDVMPLMTKVKKTDLASGVDIQADENGLVEVNYQDRFNGKAIIDVGGFVGDSVLLLRDLFSKSKIYAFEPQTGNYNAMVNMLSADIASGRIVPVKTGLGEEECTLRIVGRQGEVDSTASVVNDYTPNEFCEEIPIITFDSYVQENKLDVGLIKVDVEGFEFEIIKGAIQTIKSQRPMLVIAIYHNAKEFYELKPYLEELNLGYKFCIRRSALCKPSSELVLVAYPD